MQNSEKSDSEEDLNIGFSWLDSNQPEAANSQESYEWDNFIEDPSYIDPSGDQSFPQEDLELNDQLHYSAPIRRHSSTDNQFLQGEESY